MRDFFLSLKVNGGSHLNHRYQNNISLCLKYTQNSKHIVFNFIFKNVNNNKIDLKMNRTESFCRRQIRKHVITLRT